MAKPVNLRRARKDRARAAARAEAESNAARHGEAKPARELRTAGGALEAHRLEAHRVGETKENS